eukprot:655372-Prorocentrum_minimum.AAC.2
MSHPTICLAADSVLQCGVMGRLVRRAVPVLQCYGSLRIGRNGTESTGEGEESLTVSVGLARAQELMPTYPTRKDGSKARDHRKFKSPDPLAELKRYPPPPLASLRFSVCPPPSSLRPSGLPLLGQGDD